MKFELHKSEVVVKVFSQNYITCLRKYVQYSKVNTKKGRLSITIHGSKILLNKYSIKHYCKQNREILTADLSKPTSNKSILNRWSHNMAECLTGSGTNSTDLEYFSCLVKG